LPADVPIFILCHAGVRSAHVTRYLHENGFRNAANVAGGISAWSEYVDPSIPQY
jgi:rhodanese-related sulfurtransferase